MLGPRRHPLTVQAKRMLEDLEALGQAYTDALSEIARDLPPSPSSHAPSAQADVAGQQQQQQQQRQQMQQEVKNPDALASDLETDCGTAAGRLQEAFRSLLSIVLLSAQDRSLLKASG